VEQEKLCRATEGGPIAYRKVVAREHCAEPEIKESVSRNRRAKDGEENGNRNQVSGWRTEPGARIVDRTEDCDEGIRTG
jgi:hypothetical protein